MKKTFCVVCAFVLLLPALLKAEGPVSEGVLGTLGAVQGEVQLGEGGEWKAAAAGAQLHEGQVLRTGPEGSAEVLFSDSVTASVGEKTEIGVADLLMKTRLEQMRSKVSEPTGVEKVDMQVTPTTGVRGTEQGERKAEELKRDHFWSEEVKTAE